MDKLIDISRQAGFPWCAETAEALNNNARYIEAVMDGFGIFGRQAIILSDQNSGTPIMYIKDLGWEHGKIVRTTTGILAGGSDDPTRANLLDNAQKYALIDNSQKISIYKQNSSTEKYQDCILDESYDIVLADVNNPAWTFFEMRDFFERERWYNIPVSELSIIADTTVASSRISDCIMKYKKIYPKLFVNLGISHYSNDANLLDGLNGHIKIEIPLNYLLDMKFTDSCYQDLTATTGDNNSISPYYITPRKSIASMIIRDGYPGLPPTNAYIMLFFDGTYGYSTKTFVSGLIEFIG